MTDFLESIKIIQRPITNDLFFRVSVDLSANMLIERFHEYLKDEGKKRALQYTYSRVVSFKHPGTRLLE